MSFSVADCIEKIRQIGAPTKIRFFVFASFLNIEIGKKEVTGDSLYGLVVPCGGFATSEEALGHAARISAETKAQSVWIKSYGVPQQLRYGSSEDTIEYSFCIEDDVAKIQTSIRNRIEEVKQIRARHETEVEERNDPDSLASVIQLIYLYSTNKDRAKSYLDMAREAEENRKKRLEEIIEFNRRNPGKIDDWIEVAYPRMKERDEEHIFASMAKNFVDIQKCLRDEYSVEGPTGTSQQVFSSDDESVAIDSLVNEGDIFVPENRGASSSIPSPSSEEKIYTEWKEVLTGETTLSDFRENNREEEWKVSRGRRGRGGRVRGGRPMSRGKRG